jgi:hypothetical protein
MGMPRDRFAVLTDLAPPPRYGMVSPVGSATGCERDDEPPQ